jgi:hypothetical protein
VRVAHSGRARLFEPAAAARVPQVITRAPGYRGQYVHRRDSVSVKSLNQGEFEARAKVGLITEGDESSDDGEGYDEEYYEEVSSKAVKTIFKKALPRDQKEAVRCE